MTTTAKMRDLARLYDIAGEWQMSAQCWQAAIDLYPGTPTPGSMAEHDLGLMRAHRDDALQAALIKKRQEIDAADMRQWAAYP